MMFQLHHHKRVSREMNIMAQLYKALFTLTSGNKLSNSKYVAFVTASIGLANKLSVL